MNEILFDDIRINRVYNYLLPCFFDSNAEFKRRLKSLYTHQVGLFDYANLLNNHNITYSRSVAILFDISKYYQLAKARKKIVKNSKYMNYTMNFFKKSDLYIKDYPFHDPRNNNLHILILKIPEVYYKAYSQFIKSSFSKMYTNKQLQLFTLDNRVIKVLRKDESIFNEVSKKFYEEFQTTVDNPESLEEFDFPLTYELRKEIINFNYGLIKEDALKRVRIYNDILNKLENVTT